MMIEFTERQQADQSAFKAFAAAEVLPRADEYDRGGSLPPEQIRKVAAAGYLGLVLPEEYGGGGRDMITYGLLNEEIGRACSSLRSLLTVHGMVAQAVLRWGSKEQKASWLPRLAAGEVIGAFALSEPDAGSDMQGIETTATRRGDSFVLNGRKRWITFGQIADVYLVFAQSEGRPCAFLLERDSRGLGVEPIEGMLGTRASMLAELHLDECHVPQANLLGRPGFGISHVASSALDQGRYSVAWGCVGIARACLEDSLRYADERKQFGARLRDHQLVQEMLTNMIANLSAARLLCCRAGYLKDAGDPSAFVETFVAKYFASTAASKVAADAVQIHGANGCSTRFSVERYFRDSKVMEIIEGSTQIQQITIARSAH
jgi:alkylation response protein AidB-like acyl-CoA dehydrogenase